MTEPLEIYLSVLKWYKHRTEMARAGLPEPFESIIGCEVQLYMQPQQKTPIALGRTGLVVTGNSFDLPHRPRQPAHPQVEISFMTSICPGA